MRISALIIILTFTGLLQGCTSIQCGATPGQFLEQYERFMSEVSEDYRDTNKDGWVIYDEQLRFYILDCYVNYREEMSITYRHTVTIAAVRYYFNRYGSLMVKELKNENNEVSTVIREELGLLWQESSGEMRTLINEEWSEITNAFLEDLEVMRKELIEVATRQNEQE